MPITTYQTVQRKIRKGNAMSSLLKWKYSVVGFFFWLWNKGTLLRSCEYLWFSQYSAGFHSTKIVFWTISNFPDFTRKRIKGYSLWYKTSIVRILKESLLQSFHVGNWDFFFLVQTHQIFSTIQETAMIPRNMLLCVCRVVKRGDAF